MYKLNTILDELDFLIQKIEGLSSQQIRIIKEGDMAQLHTILERKDELIQRLSGFKDKLNTVFDEDKEKISPENKKAAERLSEIQQHISGVIKNDHASLRKAMESKDAAYFDLKKITSGRQVLKSYRTDGAEKKSDLFWQG